MHIPPDKSRVSLPQILFQTTPGQVVGAVLGALPGTSTSEAARPVEINRSETSRPIKRVESEERFKKLQTKVSELSNLWKKFQADLKPQVNVLSIARTEKINDFSIGMIAFFNAYCRDTHPHLLIKLDLDQRPFLDRNGNEVQFHEYLADLINRHIPGDFQKLFANYYQYQMNRSLEAVVDEQIYKYGTVAFTNDRMPRFITSKARDTLKAQIEQYFADKGFKLLGLGFGGVAFRINDPELGDCVLKVPVKRMSPYVQAASFTNLKDEFDELARLEEVSPDDIFSQRLVRWQDASGRLHDLSSFGSVQVPVLATWLQEGENVYEISRKRNSDDTPDVLDLRRQPSPFLTGGLRDDVLIAFMQYHQKLSKARINFYDLFLHNMLYQESKRSVCFVDSVSTAKTQLYKGIVDAREAFPIDSCIFDLVSFLHMQEQNHPFTKELHRDLCQGRVVDLEKLIIGIDPVEEHSSQFAYNQVVTLYSHNQYKQLRHCLSEAIGRKIFTREDLVAALERLSKTMPARKGEKPLPIDNDFGKSAYGNHYNYLSKDFQRIRETGRVVINSLLEHFK